jgi:hypothetical protein
MSLVVVCSLAAILIGAGPILGGDRGTLVQTAGGDLLVGYGLLQARKQQSRRRNQEDEDDREDEDLERDYRAQSSRRRDAPRRRRAPEEW